LTDKTVTIAAVRQNIAPGHGASLCSVGNICLFARAKVDRSSMSAGRKQARLQRHSARALRNLFSMKKEFGVPISPENGPYRLPVKFVDEACRLGRHE
jgi:hypothetical protein